MTSSRRLVEATTPSLLARGTGQVLRIFKAETKGLKDDDAAPERSAAPSELPPATPTDESQS